MDRCEWAHNELLVIYHDREWGMPLHDDRDLFEFLILEGMQAGLSWETILRKRENYRAAFDNFDVAAVSAYKQGRINKLLANPGIIRNRLKIEATIRNARSFLLIQQEFRSFDEYVRGFVGGKPRQNRWREATEVPAWTTESDALSRDLTRRGFKFVGRTICYAFMQAVGMVNDHLVRCYRHRELSGRARRTRPR